MTIQVLSDRTPKTRTLIRPASPFQSLLLKEDNTEAEACFVSAEATVTAAVDLRLKEAKNPERASHERRWASLKQKFDNTLLGWFRRFRLSHWNLPERTVGTAILMANVPAPGSSCSRAVQATVQATAFCAISAEIVGLCTFTVCFSLKNEFFASGNRSRESSRTKSSTPRAQKNHSTTASV
jgi:hypothetical protein